MTLKSTKRSGGGPRSLPKTFVLELTRRCNNNCSYCYNVWRTPELGNNRDELSEMSTREVKEVIAKLQEETQVAAICLSGGEPMLRTDLPEIIEFIRSRNLKVFLVTNGTLLTEEGVAATTGVVSYEVPLLSCRPDVHDRLVGRSGAWEAVVEGMMNVHLSGVHLSVVFIATRQNWNDLEATARLTMLLGADEFIYKRVNAGKANFPLAEELFITPAMLRENLKTLDGLAGKGGLPISADLIVEPCLLDVRQFQNLNFGWCPLAGEDSAFVIDPGGNVRICEHSPKILGNIKHDRFQDMYLHPYVEAFRTAWPEECASCESPLKDKCRGGCKAAAEQTCGSFTRMDPYVTLYR